MTDKSTVKEHPVPKKTIVISDTHFGDGDDLMANTHEVDRWLEAVRERGPCATVVLLGDIFDQWKSPLTATLRVGQYFLERLSLLPGLEEIIFVPGNHDHDIFMRSHRRQVEEMIGVGDLSPPPFEPLKRFRDSFLCGLLHPESDARLVIEYPYYLIRSREKEILLSHGHHLDFFASSWGFFKMFWLARRVISRRKTKPTLKEIELANLPFCGTLSLTPYVPEIVASEYRFYRVMKLFSFFARKPSRRNSRMREVLIKDSYDEISRLLPLLGYPDPYCFIFGHTHRPGMGRLPGAGVVVINSGSWMGNEAEDIPVRTWVEIERDIKLLTLKEEGPEVLYSEAL